MDPTPLCKVRCPTPASPDALIIPPGMARAQFRAMGTTISFLLLKSEIQEGAEVIHKLFNDWEQTLSRFLPASELTYLNRHAGEPVVVSALLFTVLQTALTAARETAGLYDPTLLNQLVQMGYDRTFDEVPAVLPAADSPARPGGGWRGIQLDRARRYITLPPGVGVDVGGIAKGMAVDAALDSLRLMGISTALVNAGGDLAVLGTPPANDHWPMAIEGKDQSWVIPFQRGSLATSGLARRRWQQGAQLRHHLIDPRSGESAHTDLWSVTVAAARCEQAEVAAKVALLLGAGQGRDFLEHHALAGLLVRDDGSWMSTGSWPVTLMRDLKKREGLEMHYATSHPGLACG